MHEADKRAANFAGYVECYLERNGKTDCSMTDATGAIHGTSGRGNPTAVRLIEAVAEFGYLNITNTNRRNRRVSRTAKPIPLEAFSAEDRRWAMMD